MNWKLIITLFISLLFYESIYARPDTLKAAPKVLNTLKVLNDVSLEAGRLERQYNSPSAQKIIETSEALTSNEIDDNSTDNFDSLLTETEKISLPTDAMAVYSSITDNFMPEITFSELSFRILNAVQRHLESLFQALRSDRKLVNMAIFATTNLAISQIKTSLIRREIRILSECGKKGERLRCWLAIKRMLNEIDVPKSESGIQAVQISPYGAFLLPGEIMTKLTPLSENETDEDIKTYSMGVLKAIETAGPKYKSDFTQIALDELGNYNPKDRKINSDALALFYRADSTKNRMEKISLYTEAINADPKFTAAYCNRGSCFYDGGEYEKAEEDFNEALRLDPGYYALYKYLGNCSYRTGQFENAVKNFSEALKFEINDTLLINRGICLKKLGKVKEAAGDFSSAIRFNSKSLPARMNRVQCLLALKEYDEAAKDYDKLIQLQPGNSTYYYNLGCIYAIKKQWDKVVDVWERGLLVNPEDENIIKNLPRAKARLSAGDKKKE